MKAEFDDEGDRDDGELTIVGFDAPYDVVMAESPPANSTVIAVAHEIQPHSKRG